MLDLVGYVASEGIGTGSKKANVLLGTTERNFAENRSKCSVQHDKTQPHPEVFKCRQILLWRILNSNPCSSRAEVGLCDQVLDRAAVVGETRCGGMVYHRERIFG